LSTSAFIGGYLNINKPQDWSSTDVVRKLKGLLKVKKIGHGGTLDPLATGVLPICVGAATRFADTLLLGDKSYRMTVELGSATNTYDSTGGVTEQTDWTHVNRETLEEALAQFRGQIEQVPPMYSAIRHKGKRLYELARKGIEVDRKARQIDVSRLDVVSLEGNELILDISCSHGFYARSLAHDLGLALGCFAHMTALVRTRNGVFNIEDSHTLSDVEDATAASEFGWHDLVMPIDTTLQHISETSLSNDQLEMIKYGRPLAIDSISLDHLAEVDEEVRAYDPDGNLVAILIYEPQRLGWRPLKVLVAV
jgi:tRNA pseudouridine55 synthase